MEKKYKWNSEEELFGLLKDFTLTNKLKKG